MSKTATAIPPGLVKLFDHPPLCVGEDRKQYEELRDIIIEEVKPRTVADYLLTYDIANAEWELLRLHGFKATMINTNMLNVLMHLPEQPFLSKPQLRIMFKYFHGALKGDSEARQALDVYIADNYRTTVELVTATAYENNIAAQTQTAHMINTTLQRREAAYAELERRRQNRRNEAALEPSQHPVATIRNSEDPTIAPSEQANDAAAGTGDAVPLAPGEPADHQDLDPLA